MTNYHIFYYQLMHKRIALKGVLKFTLKQLQHSNFSKLIYRVIHKSVKHFKNSQQINYSTDHGSS